MDVNYHEKLSNITLRLLIKVKEQLVVRKDIDVNKHERLSNITLEMAHNSYLKMSVKWPIADIHYIWATLLF